MERVKIQQALNATEAQTLNRRVRAGEVELDWSDAGEQTTQALVALSAGLDLLDHADALGAATMSDDLAERFARALKPAARTPTPISTTVPTVAAGQTPSIWTAPAMKQMPGRGDATSPRRHLCRALQADLIGPYALSEENNAEQELLTIPPSRYYLTGFLAPDAERDPADVGQDEELAAGNDTDEEETQSAGQDAPRLKSFWPASIGLSLLLPAESTTVRVSVSFAEYVMEPTEIAERRKPASYWRRKPRQTIEIDVSLDPDVLRSGVPLPHTSGLSLSGRIQDVQKAHGVPEGTRALALFLINRRNVGEKGRRDEQFIFQVAMSVECAEGIVPRPNVSDERSTEWDERVADLQFRDRAEYAVGHNIAVEVEPDQDPITRVRTTWLPTYEVRRVVPLREQGVTVAMDELAGLNGAKDVYAKLSRLPESYSEWIATLRAKPVGSIRRSETRDELMDKAEAALARIGRGIELLASDEQIRRAFCMANKVMAEAARKRSPGRYLGDKRPEWRLFQLAFVLMNLAGVADGNDPDRERVELIFFPTGGGKTEAYLGVIAFALVLRRLKRASLPDGGLGVAIVLRYTLRLLTLDQLGRAATLICALELERRRLPGLLGDARFSVGLWVGSTATANTMNQVAEQVTKYKNGVASNPCPLPACPWCGHDLTTASLTLLPSRTKAEEVRVGCINDRCEFCCSNHSDGVPVVFVDDQVYRELPSFLIATVDKFAMMPWRGEAGGLFGRVSAREGRRFYGPMDGKPPRTAKLTPGGLAPPELIVQDELHLISGPLGTMVGLYETAVDTLASRTVAGKVVRPKVLAATATVRRAASQIQSLYARPGDAVSVFPPAGIDDSETFFATVDRGSPGRLYIGVAAQGRSMKVILLRVYRALLAAASKTYDPTGEPDQTADGYMTVAGYFNSLRELGGMRREVDAEVLIQTRDAETRRPHNSLGNHLWFKNRDIGLEPVELTSRESTDRVKQAKDRLNRPHNDPRTVNVLLASNMISVGVDIDRLGLMVVAGQPKTTAEYIQASSRVGRDERWPGLVVTALNVHKPRDRSHYEHFAAYHESFYRHVEATSVTPFSGPALDRGLAGTLVAMTRFSDDTLTPNRGVMELPTRRSQADEAVHRLADRAGAQPELSNSAHERLRQEIAKRGSNLLDTWAALVTSTADDPKQRRYSPYDRDKTGGKPLLFQVLSEDAPPKGSPEAHFAAPTSMRDVENTAHLWLVGRRFGGRG